MTEKTLKNEFNINEETYNNRVLLYEGLIKSCSADELVNILHKYGFKTAQVSNKLGLKEEVVTINDIEEIDSLQLKTILKICGWQFGQTGKNAITKKPIYILTQKFGNDVDDLVYKKCKGSIIHISPKIYDKKIMKNGLIPKSFNKIEKYEDRVYCLTNAIEVEPLAIQMLPHIKPTSKERNNDIYEISVWLVDLNKLGGHEVVPKFFADPIAKNSVYTKNNIPSHILNKAGELHLHNNNGSIKIQRFKV